MTILINIIGLAVCICIANLVTWILDEYTCIEQNIAETIGIIAGLVCFLVQIGLNYLF